MVDMKMEIAPPICPPLPFTMGYHMQHLRLGLTGNPFISNYVPIYLTYATENVSK